MTLLRLLLVSVLLTSCHLAVAEEYRIEGVVDTAQATHETGHAYMAPLPASAGPPDSPFGSVSALRVFENERELGPAHSQHQAIRDEGKGRFSHWSGNESGEPQSLYFSASDNSDPTTNGRVYKWVLSVDPERVRQALHLTPRPRQSPVAATEAHLVRGAAHGQQFRPFHRSKAACDCADPQGRWQPRRGETRVGTGPAGVAARGAFGRDCPADQSDQGLCDADAGQGGSERADG